MDCWQRVGSLLRLLAFVFLAPLLCRPPSSPRSLSWRLQDLTLAEESKPVSLCQTRVFVSGIRPHTYAHTLVRHCPMLRDTCAFERRERQREAGEKTRSDHCDKTSVFLVSFLSHAHLGASFFRLTVPRHRLVGARSF